MTTEPTDASLEAMRSAVMDSIHTRMDGTQRKRLNEALSGKPKRQSRPKTSAPAVKAAPEAPLAPNSRPYTLESGNVAAELQRQRQAALSELEAIDAEVLHIVTSAARDKDSIQARADIEIQARQARATDLNLIVAIADRGIGPATPAPAISDQQEEIQ